MKDEVFHFCYSEVPPTLAEGNGSAKFVKVEYNSKNLLLLLRRIQIYPNRAKSKMKDKVLQILQIKISPQITRINQIWELYTCCPRLL